MSDEMKPEQLHSPSPGPKATHEAKARVGGSRLYPCSLRPPPPRTQTHTRARARLSCAHTHHPRLPRAGLQAAATQSKCCSVGEVAPPGNFKKPVA